MEFISANIPKDCRIFDTGDWHVGPHGFDEGGLDDMLAEVREDKNARMILKGDLIDAISTDDKRFCSLTYDIKDRWRSIDDHLEFLVEKLMPVRDKILCNLHGNHELTLLKQTDLTRRLCKALNVPYGGYTCILTLNTPEGSKHAFKMLLTHGRRGISSHAKDPIQSKANMEASLKKHMSNLQIYDCVYQSMGHAHKLIIVPPTVTREVMLTSTTTGLKQNYKSAVKQNMSEISPESRWYVCSGSFLKTFSQPGHLSYAELAQYGPVEIGCAEVVVKDSEIAEVKKRLF
jgi:hypothetical protein